MCADVTRYVCKSYVCFLDKIAIPDFGTGAMENWGLITYRETNLLYDEKQSSSYNKQRVASVIAHELVHQVMRLNHFFLKAGNLIERNITTIAQLKNQYLSFHMHGCFFF